MLWSPSPGPRRRRCRRAAFATRGPDVPNRWNALRIRSLSRKSRPIGRVMKGRTGWRTWFRSSSLSACSSAWPLFSKEFFGQVARPSGMRCSERDRARFPSRRRSSGSAGASAPASPRAKMREPLPIWTASCFSSRLPIPSADHPPSDAKRHGEEGYGAAARAQARRRTAAPATIAQAAAMRAGVSLSFRMTAERIVANRIEVSRRAATMATGAAVIAHSTMP